MGSFFLVCIGSLPTRLYTPANILLIVQNRLFCDIKPGVHKTIPMPDAWVL